MTEPTGAAAVRLPTGRLEQEHVDLLHAFFCTPKHAWNCLVLEGAMPWSQFLSIWYGRGAKQAYVDRIRRHLNVWRTDVIGADRTNLILSARALHALIDAVRTELIPDAAQ